MGIDAQEWGKGARACVLEDMTQLAKALAAPGAWLSAALEKALLRAAQAAAQTRMEEAAVAVHESGELQKRLMQVRAAKRILQHAATHLLTRPRCSFGEAVRTAQDAFPHAAEGAAAAGACPSDAGRPTAQTHDNGKPQNIEDLARLMARFGARLKLLEKAHLHEAVALGEQSVISEENDDTTASPTARESSMGSCQPPQGLRTERSFSVFSSPAAVGLSELAEDFRDSDFDDSD